MVDNDDETPKDVAWDELKSVGGFSLIMGTVVEISKLLGIHSTGLIIGTNVVLIFTHLFFQFKERNNEMSQFTVPKQLSRLGVNMTVFLVGVGIYGMFLAWNGLKGNELTMEIDKIAKDSEWIKHALTYLSTIVVYAMNRAAANFLLLIPALINGFTG